MIYRSRVHIYYNQFMRVIVIAFLADRPQVPKSVICTVSLQLCKRNGRSFDTHTRAHQGNQMARKCSD